MISWPFTRPPLAAVRSPISSRPLREPPRTWVALQRETRPWMRLRCLLGVEYAFAHPRLCDVARAVLEVAICPFDEVG